MTRWTAGQVLAWAQDDFKKRGMPSPRLDAEILLCDILGVRRLDLYTGFDRPLEAAELSRYREAIVRRRNGEPVAYIIGRKEFWSLSFEVTEDVLIPRPDTETLVETALALIDGQERRVLDLCTGSGCVAVAIAAERPGARVDAVDVSAPAAAIARRNVQMHGLDQRVTVLTGDLFAPIPNEATYDIITANPPYVTDDEIAALQPEVRREPRLALSGGADGLEVVRRILSGAPRFLCPGGRLLMEVDPRQASAIKEKMTAAPFDHCDVVNDLAGRERVVVLTKIV